MAMSRDRGARSVTSTSPMEIRPAVTSSSPAIMRSRVDLPQPDGPTRTRNPPLPIVSDTPSTATPPPEKTLLTLSRTISATKRSWSLYRIRRLKAMALTTSTTASIVASTVDAIGAPAKMTKQSAAREQVLELIVRLGVGSAIPSERQLSVDLGVSRLTVRAALDDLAREGYLVRRRGSGTYVQQPKISQQLTMTS